MAMKISTCFLPQNFVSFCFIHSHTNSISGINPCSISISNLYYNNHRRRQYPRASSSRTPPRGFGSQPNRQPVNKKREGKEDEDEEHNRDEQYADDSDSDTTAVQVEYITQNQIDDSSIVKSPEIATSLVINKDGGRQKLTSVQLDDLIGMISNAERNILLLDEARVRALDDLQTILAEKKALQGEINILEAKLAETDAKIKVAAQDKVQVELLQKQLEKLQIVMNKKGVSGQNQFDISEHKNKLLSESNISHHSLSLDQVDSLSTENVSLKRDIETLKEELNKVKVTDERVMQLENERSLLESSIKELESKLLASEEDVPELSTLKVEYQDLCRKVENLQDLLNKATKQADKAVLALQQNEELEKKIDKLEESLEEAKTYKLSLEKMQQSNEQMEEKIKLLEGRLHKSDEEIQSYIQLYQDTVKEFQDTLKNIEESKKKSLDETVDDMPWEFWSRLLLTIDGWLLENKVTNDDAQELRQMVWKRDRRIYDAYMGCRDKNEQDALARFLKLTSRTPSPGLHVIHIAAEMAPVAKVGGLGDVVAGLAKALQKKGHLVEIVLPKYDCMQIERVRDLRFLQALDVTVKSFFDGQLHENKIWVGTVEGLPVYFIEPLHPHKFFLRGTIYGENDDFKRFSFFSRAALELLLQAGKKPDIIHCHDWQTAFVAPLYWDIFVPKGLNSARICFTCHNFEYQGIAPAHELGSCGLDVHRLNQSDRMQDLRAHDRINPGGIVFSNIVTTVSPTHAQEVQTSKGGHGLHTILSLQPKKKFIGILNGIDTDTWNPASDSFLEVQYSAYDNIQGKAENKAALRKNLGLSSADLKQPLVGCVTRLVPQKGVHLIRHAIFQTLEMGGQFVLLGSSPVHDIQREFENIAHQFQSHDDIRLILKYDEALSHSIYAASDMLIIPSMFEPCGLTQMIAMRYGSIPIVRKTGGLNDSVFDIDDDSIPIQFRNGFTFISPDEQAVNRVLERAFNHYRNNPDEWQKLVQKVMKIDFSWDSSAVQYEELYKSAVIRAAARRAQA
ncbi:hypothetical protein ACFE04_029351 [Oxalis oulophora]